MKFNKFLKNKKGDMSFQTILIILAVFALFVFIFLPNFIGDMIKDFTGDVEVAFSDCDLDGIENELDRCPCLSTGGDSEKEPGLIGCPKGTTFAVASEDLRTCTTFKTKIGNYQDKCPKGEECTRNCDKVQATSKEVVRRKPGITTDGDLTVLLKSFNGVNAEDLPDRVDFDLSLSQKGITKEDHVKVTLKVIIKNVGAGSITDPFLVKVYVCNDNQKDCKEKASHSISSVMAPNKEETGSFSIDIGKDGDYCEGKGSRTCFVSIKVDAGEKYADHKLQEVREDNNQRFIKIKLDNQDIKSEFKQYQIMAVIDDGDDGGTLDEYGYCVGFNFDTCVEQFNNKWGLVNGKFPTTPASNGGCWVFAVESDIFKEDVGAADVSQGGTIKYGGTAKIPIIDYNPEHHSDSEEVFTKEWMSPHGGLVCKEGWWRLCEETDKYSVLMINEKRWICHDQNWKEEN
jgi:hypothetical protein